MKRGITLIEVIVSFGLSAMVFVLVSSILIAVLNSNTKSRRQERFEQVKNDLFVELGNVVRWGNVVLVNGSQLDADGNIYTLNGSRLTKNGEFITPASVQITSFLTEEFMTVPPNSSLSPTDPKYGRSEYPGVRMVVEMRDSADLTTTDTLELFVAQRKTRLEK